MYKEILFYLMLIGSVSRTTAIVMLTKFDKLNLPTSIVISSSIMAFLGIFFVLKRMIKDVKIWELGIYHILVDVSVIINFIILRFFPMDISMIETVVTGSVLSFIVSVTALFLTFSRKKYKTIIRLKGIKSNKQKKNNKESTEK